LQPPGSAAPTAVLLPIEFEIHYSTTPPLSTPDAFAAARRLGAGPAVCSPFERPESIDPARRMRQPQPLPPTGITLQIRPLQPLPLGGQPMIRPAYIRSEQQGMPLLHA